MDAGFLNVVEIGQYFMTKDTAEFSQFTDAAACCEYILPRDEEASAPKSWIRGNTKIGPVLEVTTTYLQSKYEVEIRIISMNKDNSHSWVRISHGFKQVCHEFEQQWAGNLRSAARRICVVIEFELFCMPIKGQNKTTKTRFCQLFHKNFSSWRKEFGPVLNQENIQSPIRRYRKFNSSSSSWKII